MCPVIIVQKKVIEIREQLRRTARRLGIDLKSCERDTVVSLCFAVCNFSSLRDKVISYFSSSLPNDGISNNVSERLEG